jgi:hypothetical protein
MAAGFHFEVCFDLQTAHVYIQRSIFFGGAHILVC